MNKSRFAVGTLLIVALVGIIAVIAIASITWRLTKDAVTGLFSDIALIIHKPEIDYNFEVPGGNASETPVTNEQPNDVDVSRVLSQDEVIDYAFNIPQRDESVSAGQYSSFDAIVEDAIAAEASKTDDTTGTPYYDTDTPQTNINIQIPRIGLVSPVWQGQNPQELLKQGMWIYPASAQLGKGEVAMLCHRRYFGTNDARSCWYLDKVQVGDSIILTAGDSIALNYEVYDVKIFDQNDPQIYTVSQTEDKIRIVTCTPLYSNTQRLVVMAKRVN